MPRGENQTPPITYDAVKLMKSAKLPSAIVISSNSYERQ
jgi:hypothetical protein